MLSSDRRLAISILARRLKSQVWCYLVQGKLSFLARMLKAFVLASIGLTHKGGPDCQSEHSDGKDRRQSVVETVKGLGRTFDAGGDVNAAVTLITCAAQHACGPTARGCQLLRNMRRNTLDLTVVALCTLCIVVLRVQGPQLGSYLRCQRSGVPQGQQLQRLGAQWLCESTQKFWYRINKRVRGRPTAKDDVA